MSGQAPSVSAELKALMRRLKLGQLIDTLPERLALAKSHSLGHVEFLEQLFSDEVQRRDSASAGLRARKAQARSDDDARGLGRIGQDHL